MISEIPNDECVAAIDACAGEVLWEAGVTEPPVDALAVAEGQSPTDWPARCCCPVVGSVFQELDWDLAALKDCYLTASHELIARRMLDMRPSIVITACDLGRVHWRRSNATAHPPGMLLEETTAWQSTHEFGLPTQETLDPETGLASVHCWPIHEPGWKREILRSEIADL